MAHFFRKKAILKGGPTDNSLYISIVWNLHAVPVPLKATDTIQKIFFIPSGYHINIVLA